MPKLPVISGKELAKALLRAGFVVVRQSGSHVFLRHTDKRSTIVPIHNNQEIPPGTLLAILKDIRLSREDLIKLL